MAGPWEKYAAKPAEASPKPWEKFAQQPPEELGVKGGAFNPLSLIDLFGGSTKAAGAKAVDTLTGGNISAEGFRREVDRAEKDAPVSSTIGSFMGSALQTAPLAAVSAPAAGLKGLAQAAGAGAVQGAIQKPEEGGSRLEGAALGGAFGLGGQSLMGGLNKLGEAAKGIAEKGAARAIGGQKSQFNRLSARNPNRPAEVGRFAIDEGILSRTNDADAILGKAKSVVDDAGREISTIFDEIESSGRGVFDRKQMAAKMRQDLIDDVSVGGSLDSEDVINKLDKYITNFEKKEGPATAKELLQLKGQFDGRINYSKKSQDLPELQQGYRLLRNNLADTISGRADELASSLGGNLGERLKAANQRYGLSIDARKLAENKVAQQGNQFFSLTDKLAAGVGGGAGAVTGGLAALPAMAASAAASKGLRTFGPYLGVKGADAASSLKAVPGNQPYLTSAAINEMVRQLSGGR